MAMFSWRVLVPLLIAGKFFSFALHLEAQTIRSNQAPVIAEGNVLVLGGTGRLGSRVVKRLLERGFNVTVMARGKSTLERIKGLHIEFILGDVTVEEDMQIALQGRRFHAVIDALSTTGGVELDFASDRPEETTVIPYAPAQQYLARWGNVGVDHIVLHSSVGSGNGDNAGEYPDINFNSFFKSLIEKGKAEETLRESKQNYTIIRSGAILWSPDRGMIPYTGEGYLTEDSLHVGPTTYDDLAIMVADCALNPDCINKEFNATDDTRGDDYTHWRCRRFRKSPDEVC